MHLIKLSIAILVYFSFVVCAFATQERTLIDQLTGDYLKTEQDLWRVIERREASTLQQIYNVHIRFLNKYYGESNVFLNALYLNRNPLVINSIIAINQTSHLIAKEFFEHRNYTVLSMVALNGVNLDDTLNIIYSETINSTNFWDQIHNLTKECPMLSRSVQSEHQVIFEYYKDIQAAALRTYITAQLSYMILHLHESGPFREQSLQYRQLFRDRSEAVAEKFKNKLSVASREVWNCDPANYELKGANYEITKFLQTYVDSEVNINADGSCKLTCDDYSKTKHFGCRSDTFCANQNAEKRKALACNGIVRNCVAFEDDISICPSDDNSRRYKYIKSAHGLLYGNNTKCSNELTASSWIRWFVKCSNCKCTCDDLSDSDRYFSLQDVVSDINENKIVSGVAITKINRVIQFIISQRKLQANGNVDNILNDDVQWTTNPEISIESNSTINGIDYHTLSYENRSINLDTIIAPEGQVVTGVRFHANGKGRITLQIRVTDIDITSGQLLNLENSIWLSNPNGGKNKINIGKVDVSNKTPEKSVPSNATDSYVEFGPTDINRDIAQRTIPFFEGTKSEPKVPVPLSGVGLYYKGTSGYGGFIAAKLVIYNFEPYIGKYNL